MKFDELDSRMRVFETAHDYSVLPGIYMVARIDGNPRRGWQEPDWHCSITCGSLHPLRGLVHIGDAYPGFADSPRAMFPAPTSWVCPGASRNRIATGVRD
jgi:hypothetical protein